MELNTTPTSSPAEVEEKTQKIGPFQFINSVSENKEYIFNDETAKNYQPYIVNRSLSNHPDCLFLANEMNRYSMIPPKAQYDFFFYGLTKKKRYSSWNKVAKDEDVELVMDVYGYSRNRAEQAMQILTEQQLIELRGRKGGRTK